MSVRCSWASLLAAAGLSLSAVGCSGGDAVPVGKSTDVDSPSTLTQILPATGPANGGGRAMLRGFNLPSDADVTVGGTPVVNLSVLSSTEISIRIPPAGAGARTVDITVIDRATGLATRLSNSYVYYDAASATNPAPTLDWIKPPTGPSSGGTLALVEGTGFVDGAMVFIGDELADGPQVVSDLAMTLQTVGGAAAAVDVTLVNLDGQFAELPSGFIYTDNADATVTLTAVTPIQGSVSGGTEVSLVGTGFAAGVQVFVDGIPVASTITSGSTLEFETPAHGAGLVNLAVTPTGGATATLEAAFNYIHQAPLIAGITPNSGPISGGTQVLVSGQGFHPNATLNIGDASASIISVTGTLISAVTPAGASGTADVTVTNPDLLSHTFKEGFTYGDDGPVEVSVAAITPNVAPVAGGTTVIITGNGFLPGATVFFGSMPAASVSVSGSSTLLVEVPVGTVGSVAIEVNVPQLGSATSANAFFYFDDSGAWPVPEVEGIYPTAGPTTGGTIARVDASPASAEAKVFVGGAEATVLGADGADHLVVEMPPHGAGSASVSVMFPNGNARTLAAAYTYYVASPDIVLPTLTQISPSSGSTLGGDAVSITGSGLSEGTIAFIGFRPVDNALVIDTDALSGTSPAHPTGQADVAVTRADGFSTTLASAFTYEAPAPVVAEVFPSQVSLVGGGTVALSGSGFVPGCQVLVGGVAATDVIVPLDTALTFTVPSSVIEQTVDVSVVNPDEQSDTLANALSYVDAGSGASPPPEVTTLAPPRGLAEGGTVLVVYGSGFETGMKVLFGGVESTMHLVGQDFATVTTPPGLLGPVDVTVIGPDGQSDVAPGAFEYNVSVEPAPMLVGITPPNGPQAGGSQVTLTGAFFTGGGMGFVGYRPLWGWAVLNNAIALGTTLAIADGNTDVVITNGDGQSVVMVDAFDAISAPVIDSFTPPIGPVGGNTVLTVAGANFVEGAQVFFGTVASPDVTVLGPLVIRAVTPPGIAAGPVTLSVKNPDGQSAVALAPFTFADPPQIASVFPPQGSADGDTPVIVNGTSFLSGATVTFGDGIATSVVVASSADLTARTPSGIIGQTVDVTIANVDGQSQVATAAFTFVDPATIGTSPSVSSVEPSSSPTSGGTWALIAGSDFESGAQVIVGTTVAADAEVLSSGQIRFVSPVGLAPGDVDIIVINPDGGFHIQAAAFAYTDPTTLPVPPDMTAVTPNQGPTGGGNQVELIGSGLDPDTLVFFGTAPVLATLGAPTGIEITTPANPAGLVTITVTDGAGQSVSFADAYEYVPPPGIASIDPSQGPSFGGTLVQITGTNFVAGATPTLSSSVLVCEDFSINLNCVPVADIDTAVVDDTLIALTTPPQFSGLNDVVVVNPDGQISVAGLAFYFTPAPTVAGIVPANGSTVGGEIVTLSGSDFQDGATVSIGGALATNVNVVSADTITCTTPIGSAGLVDVTVTNPDSSSHTLTDSFVFIEPPRITTIFPNLGPENGGTVASILGSGFVAGSMLTIGGTPVPTDDVTFLSAGALQMVTPGGLGPAAVRIDNPDGQFVVLAGAFLYVPLVLPPVITNVSPTFGPTGGGYQVSIVGNNFLDGLSVRFGNAGVGYVNCSNVAVQNAGTLITCEAPGNVAALVDVVVENSDGQSDTLVGGFEFVAPNGLPALGFSGMTPARGPVAGGMQVTIFGQGFLAGINVYVGDATLSDWTIAPNVVRLGPTLLRVTMPAAAVTGSVDVRLSNPPVAGPDDVIELAAFVYGQAALLEPKGHRLPIDSTNLDRDPVIFDANGDGNNDVFVLRSSGSRDDLFINTQGVDGDNGWYVDVSQTNLPELTSISGRSNPVVFDADGDGDIDIVFRHNTYNLALYRNAGDGSFALETVGYFGSLNATMGIVAADLDCDSITDLFVTRQNQRNIVLVGDGVGGFTQAADVMPNVAEPSRRAAVADVDNDGDNDVLIANDNAVQNRLHYNTCNNGTGTWEFIDAVYGTGANFPVSGFNTEDVVLTDINNDGWLDAVLANFGQSTRIYLNNGGNFLNDDGLRFPQAESNNNDTRVIATDVDLDGDVDLITFKRVDAAGGAGYWPHIYLNDFAQGGVGAFTDATPVNMPQYGGHDIDGLVVGDLNGDSLDDIYLMSTDRQDWMLWNNGYDENTPEIPANRAGFGIFVNNTFKGYPEDVWGTSTCSVADVDGDSDIDIFMNNAWNQAPRLWINDGGGNFHDDTGPRVPDIDCNAGEAHFLDLNGDGDEDLQVACTYINPGSPNPAGHGGTRQLVNDGSGFFTDVTDTNVPSNSKNYEFRAAAVGDIDDDGNIDWLAGSRYMWRTYINGDDPFDNDGAYFFNSPSYLDVYTSTYIRSILLEDLNADGYLDVYVGFSSGQNRLYHNDGFGVMTNVSSTHLPSVSDNTLDSVAIDVDLDGDVDLFVANNGTNKLHVGELDYKYADASATNLPNLGSQDSRAVVTADFDRDGLPDFMVANYYLKNHLLLNVGGASFNDSSQEMPAERDRTRCLCTGDFDGDGSTDLFACGDGANRIYLNKTPLP